MANRVQAWTVGAVVGFTPAAWPPAEYGCYHQPLRRAQISNVDDITP